MKQPIYDGIKAMLSHHKRVALQFSGGRDSLACLLLFKPFLSQITVYWLNTGDAYPETKRIIDDVKPLCDQFIELHGDRDGSIAQFGMVTDLLPSHCTPLGVASGRSSVRMQDSRSCCLRVRMIPLHQRMKDDGVTLIIRGQRYTDKDRSPLNSGDQEEGIEYCFPIQTWSDEDVNTFLLNNKVNIPDFYQWLDSTPECLHCTGWWDMDRTEYLRVHHHDVYEQYISSLDAIKQEVETQIANFNSVFK